MREGRNTTTGTLPTRDFVLVLDPECIRQIPDPVCQMVHGLADIDLPVHVAFALPYHFIPSALKEVDRLGGAVHGLPPLPFIEQFTTAPEYPNDAAEKLFQGDTADEHKALLGSVEHFRADGLLTARPVFLDQRYLLYQHHTMKIVPPTELFDFINVCAIGHSIFWTGTFPIQPLTHDMVYLETNWKAHRYKQWFSKVAGRIENKDLLEALRSLLLNRFPFLIYSREMVRFYQIQRDHYTRRGRLNRFGMAIAYHLNHFYLLLWGLLDHLTVIANYALNLNLPAKKCGIQKGRFWRKCESRCSPLVSVIKGESFDDWIETIAQVRHQAAHGTLPVPRPLYIETEESVKPRGEVRRIVLEESRDILERAAATSKEAFEWMVEAMIDEWKFERRELVSESMLFVQVKGRHGFYDPVEHIDYDLERAFAICDAFLFACFSGSAKSE